MAYEIRRLPCFQRTPRTIYYKQAIDEASGALIYQDVAHTLLTPEEKAQLEEQLKTATDENIKQSITNQINNIDARITQIDERLNQWQNVMEDVNKQLEEISRKSELPVQKQTPQQQ